MKIGIYSHVRGKIHIMEENSYRFLCGRKFKKHRYYRISGSKLSDTYGSRVCKICAKNYLKEKERRENFSKLPDELFEI